MSLWAVTLIILTFPLAFPWRLPARCPPMQTLDRSVCHSRTSDLHPVMAAGCCSPSDEAAQCLLANPKERNTRELLYANHLAGLRFGVGLDGHCG